MTSGMERQTNTQTLAGPGQDKETVTPGAEKERATPPAPSLGVGTGPLALPSAPPACPGAWPAGGPCLQDMAPPSPSSPFPSLPPSPSSSLLLLLPPLLFLLPPSPPPPGWLRASFSIWKPSLNTASRLKALSQPRGPAFSRNHFMPQERASHLPTSTHRPAERALGEAHLAFPGPGRQGAAGCSWAQPRVFLLLVNKMHK